MNEQQLQQQIVQLVQAAMQGDQQATQQIQQIMQAAQQGNQQAAQIAQMIQQVAQQMQQQQVQAARFGAKLNYIRQLKGQCPEGYKMEYYKEGGQLCKKCMKVQQNGGDVKQAPNTVAGQFKMEAAKCGKKMKKKEEGGTIESEKCGGKPKLKKKAQGGPMNNSIKRNKNQRDRNNTNKNVINGTVQTGKSSFDPTKTQLPSRNADGNATPNRLQKVGGGRNDLLIEKKKKGEDGMVLRRSPKIDYSGYTLRTEPYEIDQDYANSMREYAKKVQNDPEFKMDDNELAWRTNIGKHNSYSIVSDDVDIATKEGGTGNLLMNYDTGKPASLNPDKTLFSNIAGQVTANYRKNKGSFFTK